MELSQLFDQQIAAEKMIAEVYRKFSRRFAHCWTASSLWDKMAQEEEKYAEALYWCRTLLVDAQARAKACQGCCCDENESRTTGMETIRRAAERADHSETTLEQAAFLTLRLESLEMKRCFTTLLDLPENDIVKDVLRMMVGEGSEHARNLQTLMKVVPVSPGHQEEARASGKIFFRCASCPMQKQLSME